MTIFSYHIARLPLTSAIKTLFFPPKSTTISGLIHADTMHAMVLGSPILSSSRFLLRQVIVFAQWENEEALQRFLVTHPTGKRLAKGWHIRLQFVRQWGDAGFYFLLQDTQNNYWAQFIASFKDKLTVQPQATGIIAQQRLKLWGLSVLSITYQITPKDNVNIAQ